VDGVLPPEEAERYRAHGASCEACAAELTEAERFEALMEGEGRLALEAHEARRYTRRVLAGNKTGELPRMEEEPRRAAPRRSWGMRLVRPLAAAAAVVAVVVAYGIGVEPGPVVLALDEPTTVRAGQTALVGEASEMRADAATRVTLLEDSAGDRVRMEQGAAVFFGDPSVRLALESRRGELAGEGVAYHVTQQENGATRVAVLAGELSYDGGRGKSRRKLGAGDLLEVAPNGEASVVNHAALAELRVMAGMSAIEISSLRGDLAKLQEELSALRTARAADAPEPAGRVSEDALDELPWDQLGRAARELLQTTRPSWSMEDPKRNRALAVFLLHTEEIQQATGVTNPLDGLWHPAAIARMSSAFFPALAPEASPDALAEVTVTTRRAAEKTLAGLTAEVLPAAAMRDRLVLLQTIIRSTRANLGDEPAAEVAGGIRGAGQIATIYRYKLHDGTADDTVAWFGKRFDLLDSQRDALHPVVEDYVAQTVRTQDALIARYGEEDARRLLFPRRPPWRSGPPKPRPPSREMTAAERVEEALRNIDVKLALLAVRIDFEKRLWEILRDDQRARGLSKRHAVRSFEGALE
jgi:hypothetical protein